MDPITNRSHSRFLYLKAWHEWPNLSKCASFGEWNFDKQVAQGTGDSLLWQISRKLSNGSYQEGVVSRISALGEQKLHIGLKARLPMA